MEQEEMATARMIAVITGREGRGEAIFFLQVVVLC
jgi:hypothetical protein